MDISVSDAPAGRLLDRRYRLEALVARGGMATVYRAHDTRLDRPVALKIMHAELAADDDFVERFIGEARAVARLSDPNVVNVFDQGEDDGAVFLAMEYIEGRTLRDVLHERGRLDAALALEVAESVLSALASAHRAGIVHRDVKPENVLVGDDGRVKVADFGLARALTSSYKTTRGLLGTVSYISPEQALGERATPRSDVYSTGIMLFELLTGRPPHDGPTDFVVVRGHIDHDVPPPSESVPLPRAVDQLVLTATARAPGDRYADAGTFLAAVRAARATLDGYEQPDADDDELLGLAESHAEPRDSAGVTLDEALGSDDDADHAARSYDDAPAGDVHDREDARRGAARGHAGLSPPPPPPPSAAINPAAGAVSVTKTRVIDAPDESGPDEARATEAAPRRGAPTSAQPVRGRRGLVMFMLVLLLAVGVAAAAWWYGAGRWETTPSLLNLSAEQAQATAEEAGLTAKPGGEEFSETVAAGQVLRTEPAPGERILDDGEIVFVLSKGPERYAVPSLSGMTADQARVALADASLGVRVTDEVYHDTVAEGQVVSQTVKPGQQLRRGQEVGIVVSLGRQPIEIQDFTGQSAADAEQALTAAGFQVNAAEQFSDSVAAGLVISQDPASGSGFKGDEITLVVSSGPEAAQLPPVVGQLVRDAERMLREAGFKVEVVDLLPDYPSDAEARVVRMEPDGGVHPRGTTVTIYHF